MKLAAARSNWGCTLNRLRLVICLVFATVPVVGCSWLEERLAGWSSEPAQQPSSFLASLKTEDDIDGQRHGSNDVSSPQALYKQSIDRTIKEQLDAFRLCFERGRSEDSSFAGRILVQIKILRSGAVSDARVVTTTLGSSAVETCVVQSFMQIQFPPREGGGVVVVNYPIAYRADVVDQRSFGEGITASAQGPFHPEGDGESRVVVGAPIIIGAFDNSTIDRTVKQHLDEILLCYQMERSRDPSLAGEIKVKITILGDGTVSSAAIASTSLGNPITESCVIRSFLRFKFPPQPGNGLVIAKIPLLFHARESS